jgi:hypothetical protein
LLIKFQSLRRETVHVLIMESFGMATSHSQQASNGFFGNLHEPGRRPDATALTKMVDHRLSFGLWQLGIEQGGPASLRELFPTGATAQQAETVAPIHFTDDEVAGACTAQPLAFSIDTG